MKPDVDWSQSKRVAENPVNQPVMERLIRHLGETGMSPKQMQTMVWGVNKDGIPRGNLHTYLRGFAGMSAPIRARFEEKLGIPADELKALDGGPVRGRPKPKSKRTLTPIRAAVAQFEEEVPQVSRPFKVRQGPPLFAMNVDPDGTCSVTYNLVRGTLAEGMRAYQALAGADLIRVSNNSETLVEND